MLFFLLLCQILSVLGGSISKGDVWIDYANAGYMTTLSFSFMLETSLIQTDFIKVSLPFPLHNSLLPAYPANQGLSLPDNLQVTYQYMDNSTNILPQVYPCQPLTQAIDSSVYYIRFYANDSKTLVPIPNFQWFYLKFKLTGSDALQFQISNNILEIKIATISSVWQNAMVYDDNLAFNFFELEPAPLQTLDLSVTPISYGNDGSNLLIYSQYSIFLDVIANFSSFQYHLQENLKLIFKISQINTFLFSSENCLSVAKVTSPTISELNSSLYRCQVNHEQNTMIVILLSAALQLQNRYRFFVNITNPPIPAKNVDIEVRAMKEFSSVILSCGKAIGVLNANQIYMEYQEIFVGWGLRPDPTLPFDARVFRGNSISPTYKPYNSLLTKFKVSRTTSPTTQLKIQITIPSEPEAYALPSSFGHNLPSFPNKQVVCVVEYASNNVKRKIVCTGVGSLSSSTIYFIRWKMFFPYDIFQSQIDCSKFGVITILTVQMIDQTDNVYVLGRGQNFLNYMRTSPQYFAVGRNSTYLTYMLTLGNTTLMALSTDFQDFLQKSEQIVVTNRPIGYQNKQFSDIFVIQQSLDFLLYVQQFQDVYAGCKLKSKSDIGKRYSQTPLLTASMPKNTLSIKTSNSRDWSGFTSNTDALISSDTSSGTLTPTQGLKVDPSNQSLIFSLQAPYSDVTSVSPNLTTVTNTWGMLIMMNSKIAVNSNSVLFTQPNGSFPYLQAKAITVQNSTTYNNYTLITLRGQTTTSIQSSFSIIPTKTTFSLYPFAINIFSSVFADEDNMDIMIATVDGIDGPLNKMKFNSFFLINAYTLMDIASSTKLNAGYVAFNGASQMDGFQVPTLLRITGAIPSAINTNGAKISIFFDQLRPYFENYYTGDLYCKTSEGTSNVCQYVKGAEASMTNFDYLNYQTFSRIDICLSKPNLTFNIVIPINVAQGKLQTYFYLGYFNIDPVTKYQRLAYITPRQTVMHSSSSYTVSGTYGPDFSGATFGKLLSPMKIQASSTATLNVNSGNNVGGSFLYFSEWDYFDKGNVNISGWSNGPCYLFYYLLYTTNYRQFVSIPNTIFTYIYKNMGGVVCFTDISASISSASITVTPSSSRLPTKWGMTLPGYGAYSQNDGTLLSLNTNYMQLPSSLEIVNVSNILAPTMGPNLAKYVGKWVIPLPIDITNNVLISISGNGGINLPFSSPSGTCAIYVSSSKMPITCIFYFNPTNIAYTLIINQTSLLPSNTKLEIYHYGLSTNATYNTIQFSLKCYSLYLSNIPLANQLIFYANNVPFLYGAADTNYIGSSQILLGSYVQVTNNQAVATEFNFSFSLISKGIYRTNRIRIDLGQYYYDNNGSQLNPVCKIYHYKIGGSFEFSHDWEGIDISQGLNNIQFWPKRDIINNNITYTVKCFNFLTSSTTSPIGISGKVVNTSADLFGQLSTNSSLSIPSLPGLNNSVNISINKKYFVYSSFTELSLIITSPSLTTDSVMYIGFPSYYSSKLGPAIHCYSTYQIYCKVHNRKLTIRYMGNFAKGLTFIITITGIEVPISMKVGTFWYVIDNDDNPNTVYVAGTFLDTVNANSTNKNAIMPTLQILGLNLSSYNLRDNDVKLTLDFYLPSTLPSSISTGQFLFLNFPAPYANVLRFVSPQCQLIIRGNTLKSFITSCSIYGLRIKMPIMNSLILGSVYRLTISGLINPSNPSSNIYKYMIEITTTGNSILAKSFSPHTNFNISAFIINPISTPLNYYTESLGLISELSTFINVQSEPIYISSSLLYNSSQYNRNVYLSPFTNIYTNPVDLHLESGMNPFPIRFSSLKSGVTFIYFSKTGDGNYYSNPPPLTLTVNRNYLISVYFIEKQIKLPVGANGTRYQIGINLPYELYTMSQAILNVTLPLNSTSLALVNFPTSIQFYPQKTSALISLQVINANQWAVGSTLNMTIIPIDSNTYYGPTNITLIAVPPSNSVPNTTLQLNATNLKSASFSISCSQEGKFIYHISRAYSYNTSACSLSKAEIELWLQQSSLNSLHYNKLYFQCKDIIGMTNIILPNISQILSISNLQASTDYTISGYCSSNIADTASQLKILDFSTESNGGYITKMDIFFSSPLSTANKIKMVCALALLMNLHYEMVSTVEGYYCTDLLDGRLLEQRYQQENQLQNIRLLETSSFRIQVYFGVNTQLVNDSTPALISSLSLSQTQIINQLSKVVGLSKPIFVSQANSTYVGNNEINSGSIFVDIGPTYAYVQGINMPNNGIIYIIIGKDSLWTRDPLIEEIRKGSGPDGLPPQFFKVVGYRTSQPNSSYASFVGIGFQKLKMYIVASDDNPFNTANFGRIRKYFIEAEVPTWQKKLLVSVLMVILLEIF